jgi:uncharacterized membrane protein HdeD (DUF308 family)
MKRPPLAVIVFGSLFILAGLVGILYHLSDRPLDPWILLLRLLAIVSGLFLFLGHNWARWLLAAWLAFHVVVSAFHSLEQTAAHLVLLALVVYFLWRPEVSAFLRPLPLPR